MNLIRIELANRSWAHVVFDPFFLKKFLIGFTRAKATSFRGVCCLKNPRSVVAFPGV